MLPYLSTDLLRIPSENGSPVNEYRINNGQIEFRALDVQGQPFLHSAGTYFWIRSSRHFVIRPSRPLDPQKPCKNHPPNRSIPGDLRMLHNIRTASPCSADWEKMQGDDHMRSCAACQLSVYNFSEMP